jgi:hypothetical protein
MLNNDHIKEGEGAPNTSEFPKELGPDGLPLPDPEEDTDEARTARAFKTLAAILK